MQPSEQCHITWRQGPPTPAQRAAWDRLWRRLLGSPGPETTEAPGAEIPEVSTTHEPDCTDQAVSKTASKALQQREDLS